MTGIHGQTKAGHTDHGSVSDRGPPYVGRAIRKKKELQGLSLRSVDLSVLNPKGKKIVTHKMDMIFTHLGISGPAVLRCSQYVVKAMKKWNLTHVAMQIDSMPDQNEEQLFQSLHKQVKEDGKKAAKNMFKGLVPERYLLFST